MVLKTQQTHERIFQSARLIHESGMYRLTFHAMGTQCRVDVNDSFPHQEIRSVCKRILLWVSDFESKYSRFIPDSLIGRINHAAGEHWVEIDDETETIFNLCQEFHFMTHGAFDPNSLAILKLWNWKAKTPQIPTDGQVSSARDLSGWSRLQRRSGGVFLPKKGMGIDLGGIGKEYAVDCVMNIIKMSGVGDALIDFGQDLRMTGKPSGKPAWHIGLENPQQPGLCWTSLAMNEKAVASSGDYLRNFTYQGKRYGHIIDPRTGYPVENECGGVTVIAPTCTVAGVLATSVFLLGICEGMDLLEGLFEVEGCIKTETKTYETKKFHEYVVQ